jgi:hypothetical protein
MTPPVCIFPNPPVQLPDFYEADRRISYSPDVKIDFNDHRTMDLKEGSF